MEAIVYFPIFFPPSFYIVSKDVQSNTYWKEPTYPLTASYETLFMCCLSWVTDRYKSHRDFIWISGLDGQEGCAWLVALTPGDSRGGKFCKELASGLGSNWFFFPPSPHCSFPCWPPTISAWFLSQKGQIFLGQTSFGVKMEEAILKPPNTTGRACLCHVLSRGAQPHTLGSPAQLLNQGRVPYGLFLIDCPNRHCLHICISSETILAVFPSVNKYLISCKQGLIRWNKPPGKVWGMRTSVKNCRRGQIHRAIRSPSALLHCLSAFYSRGQVSPLLIKDEKGTGCCHTPAWTHHTPQGLTSHPRVSLLQPLRAGRASHYRAHMSPKAFF